MPEVIRESVPHLQAQALSHGPIKAQSSLLCNQSPSLLMLRRTSQLYNELACCTYMVRTTRGVTSGVESNPRKRASPTGVVRGCGVIRRAANQGRRRPCHNAKPAVVRVPSLELSSVAFQPHKQVQYVWFWLCAPSCPAPTHAALHHHRISAPLSEFPPGRFDDRWAGAKGSDAARAKRRAANSEEPPHLHR